MQQTSAYYQAVERHGVTRFLEVNPLLRDGAFFYLCTLRYLFHQKAPEHAWHSSRVGQQVGLILDPSAAFAADLHDIGKLGIDEAILNSKQRLTPVQFVEMQRHNEYTRELLRRVEPHGFPLLSTMAASAHDYRRRRRMPITFPDRRRNDPYLAIVAQVLQACDAFDVFIHGRPYQPPIEFEEALDKLRQLRIEQGLVEEIRDSHRFRTRSVA